MADSIWYEPLRITDAGLLKQDGLYLADARSVAALREAIRNLQSACGHQVWIAGFSGLSRTAQAVIGIQTIDPDARRAVLHVFTNELGLLPGLLKGILEKAFWEYGLFRLEILIPASADSDLRAIRQLGFTEEGRLRSCLLATSQKRHADMLMYSMLRPEYLAYGTAFVPFKIGVFAITGNGRGIFEADFIRYGDPFSSLFQSECAEMAGLLDDQGQLARREFFSDFLESHSSIVHASAPEPVLEAARQAQSYFSGNLQRFDLPMDLSGGSDFQIKVWETLADIPFGTTWSYEELAYRLTPDDWDAARRMARAVGSACGANPLPLILPCHRVIGKNGRLTGFSGGLDVKEFLLEHELMACNKS